MSTKLFPRPTKVNKTFGEFRCKYEEGKLVSRSNKMSSKGPLLAWQGARLLKQRFHFVHFKVSKTSRILVRCFPFSCYILYAVASSFFMLHVYFLFFFVKKWNFTFSIEVRSDNSSPSFSGHSMTKSQRFDHTGNKQAPEK